MFGPKRKKEEGIWVDVVSKEYQQIALLMVRINCNVEDVLIMEMLVRNFTIQEDELLKLLLFEKQQFRDRIALLKEDYFVEETKQLRTNADGVQEWVSSYSIPYCKLVKTVKYKLDKIKQILEEREFSPRVVNFKCETCSKTFTDLEADRLFDIESNEFRCTFCLTVVEEQEQPEDKITLEKFHKSFQEVYELLRRTESSQRVLEPEPIDISSGCGTSKSNTGNEEDNKDNEIEYMDSSSDDD